MNIKEGRYVVQQEMAEIYPPDAEELSELLPATDCGRCGFASCIEFAEVLSKGSKNIDTVWIWT